LRESAKRETQKGATALFIEIKIETGEGYRKHVSNGLVRKSARISRDACGATHDSNGDSITVHSAMYKQKTGSFQFASDRTSSSS